MEFLKLIIRETRNVKRELRARCLMYFKLGYVKKQMERRRGGCGQHGCCGISIFGRFRKCLAPDGKTCLKWDNLPKRCQLYPIDEKDKAPGTESYCSFYWEKENEIN